MRIFSKFHDYYDSAARYGVDKTITYNRTMECYYRNRNKKIDDMLNLALANYKRLDPKRLSRPKGSFDHKIEIKREILVIFCGKVYYGIELVKEQFRPGSITELCYNLESVSKFFQKNSCKLTCNPDSIIHYLTDGLASTWGEIREDYKRFTRDTSDKIIDLHIKLNSPIIVLGYLFHAEKYNLEGDIAINPCLNDVEFYKVMDSFTAFQELSMFISGVMGGSAPIMAKVSDKDRIIKHGFDEWSFRKKSEVACGKST